MALTPKQRRALARMPPKKRQAAMQNYANTNRRMGMRSRATEVLAQGVGRAPPRAFGHAMGPVHKGWDAFHPCHLPLPRSVGPYSVVRTTNLFKVSGKVAVFGPFQVDKTMTVQTNNTDQSQFVTPSPSCWCNICGAASIDENGRIDADNNTNFYHVPMPLVAEGGAALPSGHGGALNPAAFSLQIMNANALQTTSGIIMATVSHAPVNWGGTAGTWAQYGQEVLSYMRPRLMAAGKLALRGVQADSYPLDMSKCAEFTAPFVTQLVTESTGKWTRNLTPRGWAPIIIMNPDGVELEILVTVEWRTRFTFGNPAVASHVSHPVTPDSVWQKCIDTAVAAGNGIKDIVEVVASTGQAINNAREAFGRAGGQLPMLVD